MNCLAIAIAIVIGSFAPLPAALEPEPPSPVADKLQALNPFLGEWLGSTQNEVGQSKITVKASYKKILNNTVILYETEVLNDNEVVFTQKAMISWDKETEMLRAWGFRSNGQRWEASWDPSKGKTDQGPIWTCEFTIKIHDGPDQTGTSIRTFLSKDVFTEAIVGLKGPNDEKGMDLPVIEFKRQTK